MKKLFLMLLAALVFAGGPTIATAQQQKTETKKKTKEEKRRDHFLEIAQMAADKNFRFNVRSIDAKSSPRMATMNLRGGYMIKVTPQEMSVNLPLMGPSLLRGNAPGGLAELNYTTQKYGIKMESKPDNSGFVIILTSDDPKGGNSYEYYIISDESGERLTVRAVGLETVTYTGGIVGLKN